MTDDELDAEARATAHGLIQGYLGPDHKVRSMSHFYNALVQALKQARGKGRVEFPSIEQLSRIIREWAAGNIFVGEVWLFGSVAKGMAKVGSDVDLAVVIRGRDGETPSGIWCGERRNWEAELGDKIGRPVQIEMHDPDFAPNAGEACRESGKLIYSDTARTQNQRPASVCVPVK